MSLMFFLNGNGPSFIRVRLDRDLDRVPIDFYPGPEHFSHAPRLGNTAAGCEGRFRVEHFADRADARLVEVRHEAVERVARAGEIVGIDLQPRVDERTDQPPPDSALV